MAFSLSNVRKYDFKIKRSLLGGKYFILFFKNPSNSPRLTEDFDGSVQIYEYQSIETGSD